MPAQIDPVSLPATSPELGTIAATKANAIAAKSATEQADVVRKHEARPPNGTEQYGRSIKGLMARTSPPTLTAHVHQVDGAGKATAADLSKVRATHIEVKFRTAVPQIPNAKHAYIEITRANGAKQDLGAYPKGGDLGNDGGQLQFIANNEKDYTKTSSKPFELAVPSGMTRTQYANALVDGAKQYNAHAVRYDFVGQQETHFNSNSFVSSLIVAKGGSSGLADVKTIADRMDSGPVNVYGQRPAIDDQTMSERVRTDSHENKAIATGFANAGIEPARFGSSALASATPPPHLQDFVDAEQSATAVSQEAAQRVGTWVLQHLTIPPRH